MLLVRGAVNVSKAWMVGGAPKNPITTGTDPPVLPVPVVVNVVPVAESVATIGVMAVFCCVNCRMVSALAEVASASEAKPAIANLNSVERMVLFLRL